VQGARKKNEDPGFRLEVIRLRRIYPERSRRAGMTQKMAGTPFESLTALRKIEGVARPTKIAGKGI